jgi:hypothetical protein
MSGSSSQASPPTVGPEATGGSPTVSPAVHAGSADIGSAGRLRTIILLASIGRRAGRRTDDGGTRIIGLFLAAFAVAMAVASVSVVHLDYAAQAARDHARAPVTHSRDVGGSAKEAWSLGFDVVGGREFSVVTLVPLTPNAPLPPGLTQWPAPGEAVLSPALARTGADEGITSRYGRVAGLIGTAGLTTPNEKFAYVRPANGQAPAESLPIDGFGTSEQPPTGDRLVEKPEWMFQLTVLGLVGVPALVLLVMAARTGAQARDRRTALASVLGGGRRHLAVISVAEAIVPILGGAGLALATALVVTMTGVDLPIVGYTVAADDIRGGLGLVLVAWMVGVVLCLAAVILLNRPPTTRRRRQRPLGTPRPPVRIAVLCPVMLLISVQGPGLFDPESPLHLLVNYTGVIGTLITLPAVVSLTVGAAGTGLARLGRAGGLPGTVVSGRWMAARPGSVARVTAGIITGIGLLIQAQVWFAFLGQPVQEARAAHAALGDTVQVVETSGGLAPARYGEFFRALPAGTAPIRLDDRDAGAGTEPPLVITASCPALTALRLPCRSDASGLTVAGVTDPRLRALIGWNAPGTGADPSGRRLTVQVAEPDAPASPDSSVTLAVVALDGGPIDPGALERIAYRTVAGGALVEPIGGSWLVGAAVNADQGRWLLLWGAAGVVVITLAAGLAGLAEFRRWGRHLAVIGVLAGNRRVFYTSAAWSVFLPVMFAGAIGTLVGVWTANPMVADGLSHYSAALITECLTGVTALAVLLWLWAASSTTTRGRVSRT